MVTWSERLLQLGDDTVDATKHREYDRQEPLRSALEPS